MKMKTCKVSDLFFVRYGVNLELNTLIQDSKGINFVSRTSKNNGVSAKVKPILCQVDFPENNTRYKQTGKSISLGKIFTVVSGLASSEVIRSAVKENANWIPYIRPSYRQETSIDAYVNKNAVPCEKVFPAKTLYVSTDGQGSHTFSYVSTFEFVPNSNVSILIPKREMGLQEKLFYAQCITNNRYKFSYGRKPKGERLKSIMLPEYPPDYVLDYNIDSVMQSFNSVLEKV